MVIKAKLLALLILPFLFVGRCFGAMMQGGGAGIGPAQVLGYVAAGTLATATITTAVITTATITTGTVSTLNISQPVGAELAPALTEANWTHGAGWTNPVAGNKLEKSADGTGTMTTTAATTIVAGATYRVILFSTTFTSGSATYTLGGVTGASTLAAADTSYTDYITTTTTGKLIITPTNTSRFDITTVSIRLVTGGLIGTTTNDLAPSGTVGEFFSSYKAVGAPVSLSTNTVADVTSIALTAGDWDVEGNINLSFGSTTVTATQGALNTTATTLPTDGSEVYSGLLLTTTSDTQSITLPRKRVSLSTSGTVYMPIKVTFSAGTVAAFGGLTARRVR